MVHLIVDLLDDKGKVGVQIANADGSKSQRCSSLDLL